jgi:multicomponent K+:H+ antiporter subunit A
MTLSIIVLLPFLAIVPAWLVGRQNRFASMLVAAAASVGSLLTLATLVPRVMAGEVLTHSWPWIERLGLDLAFRLDGLAVLFGILILGIGTLVVVYAYYYLSDDDPIGSFYAMLMTFMGAMMGVVMSENVLLMVMFWELTSISSFLLIGYWSHLPAARQGARMALGITGGGGLALLGGVILLGHIVGSFDLTTILASNQLILAHDLYFPALVLILLGAFTKSAQFPFHFWLPNAMNAPTPVSSYLHSATMVKAGVFLLARMHPALSGSTSWFVLVTGAGLVTLCFAAYVALFKHDLKGLLAYSTISHLGIITACFGFSTKLATMAGVFHIMNHAAFKASLFMSAGIVDHETGTRDARILSGLRHSMPITSTLAILGTLAMAGFPLFNGFLSKEMFFEEAYHLMEHPLAGLTGGYEWLFPVLVTFGGLCSMAYSFRLIGDVFLGEEAHDLPKHPHDPPAGMWGPVAILVSICVLVGVLPFLFQGFVVVVAQAVIGGPVPEYTIAIWHGLTPALGMTGLAIAGGGLLYWKWRSVHAVHMRFAEVTGKQLFETFVDASVKGARLFTGWFDNGSMQRYVAISIGFATYVGFLGYFQLGWTPGRLQTTPAPPIALIPWVVLVAATVLTIRFHRKRITAIIMLSVIGLIISLMFIFFSGPDLGLTQLSVEVVTILLILLALYVLPQRTPRESGSPRRWRDAALSCVAGLGVGGLAYGVLTRPQETISDYYLEKSVPEGGGSNVVNVILVDFRGFDTMGEIAVLMLAAIGIVVMLYERKPTHPDGVQPLIEERFPAMLTTITRPMMALILVMAFYIFMRGHNLPGGGFIAGLVASVALIIQFLASGRAWTNERLTVDFARMGAVGVIIAVCTGLAAFLFERPFLKGGIAHVHVPGIGELHLASAMSFDLGVFMVVVGALLIIIKRLSEYHGTNEVVEAVEDR